MRRDVGTWRGRLFRSQVSSRAARRAGQTPGSWLPVGALTWSTAILFLDGLSVGPLDTGNPKAGSPFPARQDPCVDVLLGQFG